MTIIFLVLNELDKLGNKETLPLVLISAISFPLMSIVNSFAFIAPDDL